MNLFIYSLIILKMYSSFIQLILIKEKGVLLDKSQTQRIILNQRFSNVLLQSFNKKVMALGNYRGKKCDLMKVLLDEKKRKTII